MKIRLQSFQIDLVHGTKDVLAHVHGLGSRSRFRSADVVGTGRHYSNFCLELVGRLSQRLVLDGAQNRVNRVNGVEPDEEIEWRQNSHASAGTPVMQYPYPALLAVTLKLARPALAEF